MRVALRPPASPKPGETGYFVTFTTARVVTPFIVTETLLLPAAVFTLNVAEFEVSFFDTDVDPATTTFAV